MTLLCEQNTPAIDRRVMAAARAAKLGKPDDLQTFFEHGQWRVEACHNIKKYLEAFVEAKIPVIV